MSNRDDTPRTGVSEAEGSQRVHSSSRLTHWLNTRFLLRSVWKNTAITHAEHVHRVLPRLGFRMMVVNRQAIQDINEQIWDKRKRRIIAPGRASAIGALDSALGTPPPAKFRVDPTGPIRINPSARDIAMGKQQLQELTMSTNSATQQRQQRCGHPQARATRLRQERANGAEDSIDEPVHSHMARLQAVVQARWQLSAMDELGILMGGLHLSGHELHRIIAPFPVPGNNGQDHHPEPAQQTDKKKQLLRNFREAYSNHLRDMYIQACLRHRVHPYYSNKHRMQVAIALERAVLLRTGPMTNSRNLSRYYFCMRNLMVLARNWILPHRKEMLEQAGMSPERVQLSSVFDKLDYDEKSFDNLVCQMELAVLEDNGVLEFLCQYCQADEKGYAT